MEFKGTKGKWEMSINPESNGWVDVFFENGNSAMIIGSANCERGNPAEETKANALLISKAPEMLEMLNDILFKVFWNGGNLNLEDKDKIEQLIKESTEL